MATCSGDHKTRLFIGEAGFRGVSALIDKHQVAHPNLGNSIIATELDTFGRTSDQCQRCNGIEREEMTLASQIANLFLSDGEEAEDYSADPLLHTSFCSDRCKRIRWLQNKGVTIILGFDGTKIHESNHPALTGRRLERIHWNCPHDKSNFRTQTLPPIIKSFFASCSAMQESGDRVHVTLAQPHGKADFYQGYVYNIRDASTPANYKLLAKRPFGPDRYPGYEHEMTGIAAPAAGAHQQREFVFVKKPFQWPAGRPKHKRYDDTFYSRPRKYYERDTDEESSVYSHSSGTSESESSGED
ncbi:MAG: hypothetical protein S4CHLAM6_09500 [Chlamydiae bacterium]|nr:hypothetical protein [Chlamydiota bacterium]